MLQGVSILLLMIVGSGFALLQFSKNRINSAFYVILLIGFLLRIYCSLDPYLHEWDERFHALVAKNLIENPLKPTLYQFPFFEYDFKSWQSNHVWLHKQPLPLWTIALSLKTFGTNVFAVRIPSILLSTLCIWFTFLIGKKMFNPRVGFLAAFFLSINGLVIEITSGRVTTDHVDLFFMFFIELGVLLSVFYKENPKKYLLVFIGVSIGLAILCKWLPALIVLPVFFVLNFKKGEIYSVLKKMGLILLVSCLVFLPWQIYSSQTFPEEYWWEQIFNLLHMTEGLEGFGNPWWYFIDMARMVWNELIYLAFGWFLYLIYQKKNDQNRLAILVWIVIPYIFFSMVSTKMQGYVLFTAPAVFIVLALFAERLLDFSKNTKPIYNKINVGLLVVIVLLSIRYGVERVKPFSKNNGSSWSIRIEKLAKENPSKLIVINEPRYIEAMFRYDIPVYEKRPAEEELLKWKNKGYKILIREGDDYSIF
ncbi:MAG: ArnT family glycosyltransferase [Saprospiraceae bacterium]